MQKKAQRNQRAGQILRTAQLSNHKEAFPRSEAERRGQVNLMSKLSRFIDKVIRVVDKIKEIRQITKKK